MPRTRRAFIAAAAIATAVAVSFAARPGFDRDAWLADYGTLRDTMEARYANLTALADGRVNVPALHARTEGALRAARSDGEAKEALRAFVGAFGDGHLRVTPREAPAFVRWIEDRWTGRGGTPRRDWSASQACDAFGYRERDGDFSLPLEAMGPVTSVARKGSFRAATVTLAGGAAVGVVRIPLLSQRAYRVECEEAWNAIRATLAPDCADCEERLYRETGDRLLATLARRLDALRATGARALVVDLMGNGGGSEWAEEVARVLTARPVRSARAALVRGESSAHIYEWEIERLDSVARDPGLQPRARAAVDSARARYVALRDEARTRCDLSTIWRSGWRRGGCTNLVAATTYSTGVYDHLAADALGDSATEILLHAPVRSARHAGAWSGPLFLLVDRGTASASEEVVAALQDSRAGIVVGTRTLGAGCGFVGERAPLVLPRSGIKVEMPNCVRLRVDGRNEVLGVTPDLPVGWHDGDDDDVRARKLAGVLASALAGR